VICGAGLIDVFAAHEGSLAPVARIPTAPGARTGLFVPDLDRLFIAVPASTQESTAVWVFKPSL
jgi:hypothetical protein